jgi:Tol biopolymer transport system component
VLSGINTSTWSGAAFLSVSETGNLIYLPRNKGTLNVLDIVDRSGNLIDRDSIPAATLERIGHGWTQISISPSGNEIAFNGRSFGILDIWLLNLDTGDPERITFNPSEDEYPVWSPDGNAIAYTSSISGAKRRLYIQNIGSAGNPHLIRIWPRHIHFTSWSPDGKWLAAHDYTSTNGTDCYAISVDSGESISVATSQANESGARFSPDGRYLAYQSDESGRYEIYVISFPKLNSKRQISIDGGTVPHWDRNGKFIYYISNGFMIGQPVDLDNDIKKDKPIKLFLANASNFDISPDGQKFYLVRSNIKRQNPPLYLITNWFEELKTKTTKK